MKTRFHDPICGAVAVVALGLTPLASHAQEAAEKTTPLTTVIAAVAKHSGKKFFVDPRVSGNVLLLQENPAALSYDDLLMLLRVHGFAAVTNGDYVSVVPDTNVRQMALPRAGEQQHPLAQYVTKVIHVKGIPAAMLVPVLRPLLPQQAHLTALPCTNDLIVVDTFGNIQRLETVISALNRDDSFVPPKCSWTEPARDNPKVGNQRSGV